MTIFDMKQTKAKVILENLIGRAYALYTVQC